MTIKEARKILKSKAKKISDKEIIKDIEIATLFKDLFFNNLMKNDNKLVNYK